MVAAQVMEYSIATSADNTTKATEINEGFGNSNENANETCPECGEHFYTLSALGEHLESHLKARLHGKALNVCEQCGKVFAGAKCTNHLEEKHGALSRNSNNVASSNQICGKVSVTSGEKTAMNIAPNADTCGGCDDSQIAGEPDVKQKPVSIIRMPIRSKLLQPTSPTKKYKDQTSWKILQNGTDKAFQGIMRKVVPKAESGKGICLICHMEMAGSDLKTHMKTHTDKQYSCLHCDISFKDLSGLSEHATKYHSPGIGSEEFLLGEKLGCKVSVTNGNVTCQCHKCGKYFNCITDFVLHKRLIHSGIDEHGLGSQRSVTSDAVVSKNGSDSLTEQSNLIPCTSFPNDSCTDHQSLVKHVPSNGAIANTGSDTDDDEELLKISEGSLQFLQSLTEDSPTIAQATKPGGVADDTQRLPHSENLQDTQHVSENPQDTDDVLEYLSQKHPTMTTSEKQSICQSVVKNRAVESLIIRKDGKFICKPCGLVSSRISDLRRHIRIIHLKVEQQKCPECGKIIPSNVLFKIHMRTHTGERPFLCKVCGKSYTTSTLLRQHEKDHSTKKPPPCTRCGKIFSTFVKLRSHMKVHYNIGKRAASKNVLNFLSTSALHISINDSDTVLSQQHSCVACKKSFIDIVLLKQHVNAVHHMEVEKTVANTNEVVSSSSNLLPSSAYTVNTICTKPQQSTTQRASLVKRHACYICGKLFTHISGMKLHIRRIHFREQQQTCSICRKLFTTKALLRIHMRTHTGERPYMCEVCGKSYTTNHTLKMHAEKHSTVKPPPCSRCGKAFPSFGELRIHRRRVHYNINQSGIESKTTFQFPVSLEPRRQTVGVKPQRKRRVGAQYGCELCQRAFTKVVTLESHMSRIHAMKRGDYKVKIIATNERQ